MKTKNLNLYSFTSLVSLFYRYFIILYYARASSKCSVTFSNMRCGCMNALYNALKVMFLFSSVHQKCFTSLLQQYKRLLLQDIFTTQNLKIFFPPQSLVSLRQQHIISAHRLMASHVPHWRGPSSSTRGSSFCCQGDRQKRLIGSGRMLRGL